MAKLNENKLLLFHILVTYIRSNHDVSRSKSNELMTTWAT